MRMWGATKLMADIDSGNRPTSLLHFSVSLAPRTVVIDVRNRIKEGVSPIHSHMASVNEGRAFVGAGGSTP